MMHDDLVELSEHLQVLNNVRILVCYEHKEKLVNWYEDISDHICLNMSRLPSLFNELWEICHVLFHLETVNRDELTRY